MYTSALSKLGGVKLARHNRESRAFRKDPWPEFWPGFKPRPTREPSREIIPRRVLEGKGGSRPTWRTDAKFTKLVGSLVAEGWRLYLARKDKDSDEGSCIRGKLVRRGAERATSLNATCGSRPRSCHFGRPLVLVSPPFVISVSPSRHAEGSRDRIYVTAPSTSSICLENAWKRLVRKFIFSSPTFFPNSWFIIGYKIVSVRIM